MDYQLTPTPATEPKEPQPRPAGGEFEISSMPCVGDQLRSDESGLTSSSSAPMLCLMARDPHTVFAYWDIDWTAAFRDGGPADRKVGLRILNADGSEQAIDIEPMAGGCYVTVETADAVYSGDIGFYQPPTTWNSVATSALISTPPENLADAADSQFATVPFHLSFQHMIDMLRTSRREDAPLIAKLADLRERAGSGETNAQLTSEERELARAVDEAEAASPHSAGPESLDVHRRRRLERILGFGGTSPSEGFGGNRRAS